MTSEYPIEVLCLTKRYGEFIAVDDITLNVKKNSFTGLLGPNGAGKSTIMKILTNLARASSGNVMINGIDVEKEPKTAMIGVGTVVETPEFYNYMTPREMFSFTGELLGMSSESISDQTQEILSNVKMTNWADNKIGTFSKGMKQRITLGISLMDNPNIIILDEPTSGLDPRGMAETREILKDLRDSSKDLTILMSSHLLHEVADLCDRVAIIDHGKLRIHDDIGVVTGYNRIRRINLNMINSPTEDTVSMISRLNKVKNARIIGNKIFVEFEGDDDDQLCFFNELTSLNVGIFDIHEEDALESAYLDMIEEVR